MLLLFSWFLLKNKHNSDFFKFTLVSCLFRHRHIELTVTCSDDILRFLLIQLLTNRIRVAVWHQISCGSFRIHQIQTTETLNSPEEEKKPHSPHSGLRINSEPRTDVTSLTQWALTLSAAASGTPGQKHQNPQNQLHVLILWLWNRHQQKPGQFCSARSLSLTEASSPAGQTGCPPEKRTGSSGPDQNTLNSYRRVQVAEEQTADSRWKFVSCSVQERKHRAGITLDQQQNLTSRRGSTQVQNGVKVETLQHDETGNQVPSKIKDAHILIKKRF